MTAPITETFDDVVLSGDGDGDDTRSFGGSSRTFNDWTINLLDASGNIAPGTGGMPSVLEVTGNSMDSDLVGDGDNALSVNGWPGIAAEAQFAATGGEEFWLQSFNLQSAGMGANVRVLGYRDGVQVASHDFTAAVGAADTLVTLDQGADPDWQNIDEFRIVQQDGSADISFYIDDITVAGANVAPVINNLNDSITFTEDGAPVLLDAGSDATVVDSDSVNFDGGNITVTITADGAPGEDVLSVRNEGSGSGQVGLSGSDVLYGGEKVGTISGGTGTNDMVIGLNSQATPNIVEAILRNLTYANINPLDPSTAAREIQIHISDGDGGTSDLSLAIVGVTEVNDAPTLNATGGTPTYTENGSAVDLFSGVSIGGVEFGQTITGMTLTVTNLADGANEILTLDGTDVALTNGSTTTATNGMTVAVSLVGGTATITLSKAGGIATADAEALVEGISYRNSSESPDTANRVVTLTSISDSGGTEYGGNDTTSLSVSATVSVTAVNDAPVVGNLGGDSAIFTEDGAPVLLDAGSDATVMDIDSIDFDGGNITVAIISNRVASEDVLSISGAGQVGLSGSSVLYNGVQVGTISGGTGTDNMVISLNDQATPAAVQAILRNLTYANTNSLDPSTAGRTIQISVNDGDGGGGTSNLSLVTVGVASVNDAPVVSVPASISVTEDVASALTGISFSDADAGSGIVVATFFVGTGTLAASSSTAVGVSGSGTFFLDLIGSIAEINAFIAGGNLTYTTAANATADVRLDVHIDDVGYTGSGGAQRGDGNVTLQVTAVNDAPVISAPTTISVNEDVSAAVTGISFADVDAGSGSVTVAGSGTGSMILTGSIADINAFIAPNGVSYQTALNATSNVVLTVDINDGGNTGSGGAQSDVTTVTLAVTAVNDAPVNNVPAAQTVGQDSVLVFSSGNGNQISISDVDAGSGTVRVTLTGVNGLITLGSTTGLNVIIGSGIDDSTMTFEGTLAHINAALDGMVFSPNSGYHGPASLQIFSDDLGSTGSGGNQTDSDIIAITVDGLNPKVTSVNVTNPDGAYLAGDTVTVTVTFDQAVTVNTAGGTPSLLLETGAFDHQAAYVSGSGSNTLTFSYAVQAGDLSADLDYQSTGALSLNGATIRNATNDDALLTLPTVGGADSIAGQHDIAVDGVAPAVTSVSVPVNGTYASGQNLDFTVNLSESVVVNTGGGTPRIALSLDTGGTLYANYVSGSGTSTLVFRLTISDGLQDLTGITLGSSIDLNSGTLRDAVGNNAVPTLNSVGSTTGVLVDTAPVDIAGTLQIDEAAANGSVVGALAAIGGSSYTFSLVSGGGDDDNANFAIDSAGSVSVVNGLLLDYEQKTTFSIRVRAEFGGVGFEKVLTGTVNDVNPENITGDENPNVFVGGALDDHLSGAGGADTLSGGIGNDVLNGGDGDDLLNGGAGDDYMVGGAGNDIYVVASAGDQTIEAANGGADTVRAYINWVLGNNIERLELQGSGNLNGTGNALNNTLVGNSGDNVLNGGAGNDYMVGGAGNDTYIVAAAGDRTIETADSGTDTVRAYINWTLADNVERLELAGTALNGTGNTLENVLIGTSGNNYLNGHAGADQMYGGAGNDVYTVAHAGDQTIELANEGTDTVKSYINWTLADNVERLELAQSSSANLSGTGNALNNTLIGNSANNTLNGGGNNDYLYGGSGNDTLIGGAGADSFVFTTALSWASNIDRISDFSATDDRIVLDKAIFAGLANWALAPDAFHIGPWAQAADDRIIYNSSTGALLFDADGAGGVGSIQFATLSAGLALTADHFLVV
jgi:Ca2+-binding RTX toxin-like protein